MIYITSQVFFDRFVRRLVPYKNYVIVDGNNYGITLRAESTNRDTVYGMYSNTQTVSGFCPNSRLYDMLINLNAGKTIHFKAFEREIDVYLEDISYIGAVWAVFQTLVNMEHEEYRNIFIVLPNVVYKYMHTSIHRSMQALSGCREEVVRDISQIAYDPLNLNDKFRDELYPIIRRRISTMGEEYGLDNSLSSIRNNLYD